MGKKTVEIGNETRFTPCKLAEKKGFTIVEIDKNWKFAQKLRGYRLRFFGRPRKFNDFVLKMLLLDLGVSENGVPLDISTQ
jgi:hypothetical protein